ncbi:hypothetical protein BE221DRAFT_142583 [Ostreococcus tauri]|uniref:Uncharacterized protein n=1 Tax=Ostreococcus tauri TaxID=70448 RepID=A0A1Y5I3M9_OSTTA|nr:hypothetical protein BE221DRAFT_142583 [Ostreococcus tauri]
MYTAASGQEFTVWPISFSAPETMWVPVVPVKEEDFATIIPGNLSTYVYNDELSYYGGYRIAKFAVTRKKGGWDCMRHIEIMANGAVPFFPDLQQMPSLTMQHYPKALFHEARKFAGVTFSGGAVTSPASYTLNEDLFDFEEYYKLANKILTFSREHLTTRAMASYILKVVGFVDSSLLHKVLIVTHCVDDYVQDATLHGLKLLLGKRLTDIVPEAHKYAEGVCVPDASSTERYPDYHVSMYMKPWAAQSRANFATKMQNSYGKGFTLWNKLDYGEYGDVDRSDVLKDIQNGSFDIVILSDRFMAVHHQTPEIIETIKKSVPKEKVVMIFGGDGPVASETFEDHIGLAGFFFAREIV